MVSLGLGSMSLTLSVIRSLEWGVESNLSTAVPSQTGGWIIEALLEVMAVGSLAYQQFCRKEICF